MRSTRGHPGRTHQWHRGPPEDPLPHIAAPVPDGAKPESRITRFARGVDHAHRTTAGSWVPYAEALLAPLALPTLVLVMAGSVVGHGCVARMRHGVYKGRALPLAWVVRRGKTGPVPEALHSALREQGQELIPLGARVVVLGDGAGAGLDLQHTRHEAGWLSVCRTGSTVTASWDGTPWRLETVGAWIKPDTRVECLPASVPRNAYGPVRRLCGWAKGYQGPLYLSSTMDSAEEAWRLDAKRFRIETFFADQKSRGFHRHTSHLSNQERLSRLVMAACLASMWMVYLGAVCTQDGWMTVSHRGDRWDVSLFQRGLRLLDDFLPADLWIPVAFHIVI